jgi:hypothetical protein
MSSSESNDFASTASEDTNIESIGSSTSVGTVNESIGSTIPFDPCKKSTSGSIAATTAVPRDTDIALVALLLSPNQNDTTFVDFCNKDHTAFGEPNSKFRKSVQNRRSHLKKVQSKDPVRFAALAENYDLIKLPDTPLPSTPRRSSTPALNKKKATPRSSQKKKKTTPRSASRPPSDITILKSRPPIAATTPTAATTTAATMSECKSRHSFFLYHHQLDP